LHSYFRLNFSFWQLKLSRFAAQNFSLGRFSSRRKSFVKADPKIEKYCLSQAKVEESEMEISRCFHERHEMNVSPSTDEHQLRRKKKTVEKLLAVHENFSHTKVSRSGSHTAVRAAFSLCTLSLSFFRFASSR
jgi:hypothetical protein